MIHLINDYYMTADGNSYTVAKAVQRDAGKFSMNRARYFTLLLRKPFPAQRNAPCVTASPSGRSAL